MEPTRPTGTPNEGPLSGALRKTLLLCGILASLLYVALTVVGALRFEGYSSVSQTISELSAIGAGSRPVVVALGLVYDVLMVAFGVGVVATVGRGRSLRIAGVLLVAYGLIGFVAPFTPMHLRGEPVSLTDTLHVVLTSVTVLLMLLYVGFGALAFGRAFRTYSVVTLVVLLVFGALAGLQGPRVAADLPTPWVGVVQRISVFSALLWNAVLAGALLRPSGQRGRAPGRRRPLTAQRAS